MGHTGAATNMGSLGDVLEPAPRDMRVAVRTYSPSSRGSHTPRWQRARKLQYRVIVFYAQLSSHELAELPSLFSNGFPLVR